MEPTISRSVDVAADPGTVWSMITDLPRMGEFSPENAGGRWVGGATGPALGAEFRGVNRNGHRQWWTRVRVVACVPGRRFTFDVRTPFGARVSRWSYEITPTATGCRLTEHWYRVAHYLIRRFLGPRTTGPRRPPRLQRLVDRAHPRRRQGPRRDRQGRLSHVVRNVAIIAMSSCSRLWQWVR